MIVAKTRGLGGLISLEEDGESYDVSAAGRGFLRRFMGQTYSVVERASGTQALVKYKVLVNRLEIRKNSTKASLHLRTVRPSRLDLFGEEYQVRFGKLRGTIDIEREGEHVASGSITTTSVSVREARGPVRSILPELAVGLCIWLKNFQGLRGAMGGGQA